MTMFDYAQDSKFVEIIKQMQQAETGGSTLYYTMAFLAKEKGYDDLYEAIVQNAVEDSLHGGMYNAMLGKGKEDEEAFWKMVVGLYQAEKGAEGKLRSLADTVRQGGEEQLAACIEGTIEEENEHARRLEKVFQAHGIAY
ncbi:MAG: hypothetical protein K6F95_06055 [Selenomonas sp.]|uniref:ferritin family protein n=1 Tax=Selenomonas sp. TaxID=2053611 RepID=UPI0025E22D19|nr:ferritin family protein [Selenomonas sp.]MCR5757450.1 hypothetical protein [Selenomonas sp.]